MFLRTLLLIFIILLLSFVCVESQQQAPKAYTEEVSVSLTNLYASVRDPKGRPVYGLSEKDFVLTENGKRLPITHFSSDVTEPVNVAFLLDVSGSMRMQNKFDAAKGIIRGIVDRMDPQDEGALLIFADGEVEMLVEFTKDKQALLNRMELLKAYGGTALRNAVAFCHRLLIDNVGKKGILLLSDGVDNKSDLTIEQATEQAARVEVPIYAYELIRSEWMDNKDDINEEPLRIFAEATGGLYFRLEGNMQEDIAKACAKIFQDLKHQYYIGYSTKSPRSGKVKIDLRTMNKKHRVRVRYSVIH